MVTDVRPRPIRTAAIANLGCKVNQAEMEGAARRLRERGIAVVDELVRQPEVQHRHGEALRRQDFRDRTAGAAGDYILFHRHQRFVRAREAYCTTLAVAGIFAAGTPEQLAEWVPQCFGSGPDDIMIGAYCVSKAGLVALTRDAAQRMRKAGHEVVDVHLDTTNAEGAKGSTDSSPAASTWS